MAPQRSPSPYAGLKVIEVADDIAGELTGRFLAELGADVLKVEPPEGAPTRHMGPWVDGIADPERSLTFRYYNRNKSSVVLDRSSPDGRRALRGLLRDADVLVSTMRRAELDELGLRPGAAGDEERLIVLSVTPFGLDGPWASYRTSDLVSLAAGGPLITCGYDDHTLPPIRPGGNQAFHTAASFAHLALLLALIDRERTGSGQAVDVSMHDSLAVTVEMANPYWSYSGAVVQRQTCRHAEPVATESTLFRTADGRYLHYRLITVEPKVWKILTDWMRSKGMVGELDAPSYLDPEFRKRRFGSIRNEVAKFFLAFDGMALYREGQARGLPIGIVNAPEDLLDDAHLLERGFFSPVAEHDGVVAQYPGLPYRFSSFDPPPAVAAPRLGVDRAPTTPRGRT